MKSILPTLTILLSAALGSNAQSSNSLQCVDGTQEPIGGGFAYQHKCNYSRAGRAYNNVKSTTECMMACVAQDGQYCSYTPSTKVCALADKNSVEVAAAGTILLTKVPYTATPAALTCAENLTTCEKRESDLKQSLALCTITTDQLRQNSGMWNFWCPKSHMTDAPVDDRRYRLFCGRTYNLKDAKTNQEGVQTLGDCLKLCNGQSWCTYGIHDAINSKCYLSAVKVSTTVTPSLTTAGFNIGIKY